MELNEIKSQLASLMNFGKISVSSGAGSDAFAQMLNNGTEAERPEVRENDRAAAAAKADRSDRREVHSADKSPVADKKNKPAKNDNRKADNKVDASAGGAVDAPREDVQTQQKEEVFRPEGESTAVEDVPAAEVPAVDAAPENAGDEGGELTVSVLVPLADLSMMGMINVINPETGEMVQMTGAELAAQLAGDDSVQVLMSTPQNGEPIFKIQPADTAQNMMTSQPVETDGAIDVSAFAPVDDADAVELNMEAVKAQVQDKAVKKDLSAQGLADDLADGKVSEQAAKLSEVIGRENKAEVKVSVHEEKIAQLSAKDLLADAGSVDEAITISSKPAAVSAQNAAETLQSQGSQPAAGNGNNVQNLNVAPAFNAAVSAASETGVANMPAAANAEVSSAGLGTTATVAGGEFVRAAKADAASENGQTSFRDVYKGMSREVVEQVKVNITKSAVKGIDKIDISLKPEDLGHIEIKMQIGKDGKLQAHIISTRPETMEALQKEMQSLEKAFNDAGFQTDEGSLSFSFRDGNQANQNQERENGLRSFIGDIFEKEAGNDLLGDAFQNQSWNGTTGLNIRV
jgi:flagellar hook-length control protein FliK